MGLVLQTISIVAAVSAAVFWFVSASVRVRNEQETVIGSTAMSQDILTAIKRQSTWSARAAICAAISAGSQAIAVGLPTL